MHTFSAPKRLSFLIGAPLLAWALSGCAADASECQSDDECGDGEVCVEVGGIFVSGGKCTPAALADGGSLPTDSGDGGSIDAGDVGPTDAGDIGPTDASDADTGADGNVCPGDMDACPPHEDACSLADPDTFSGQPDGGRDAGGDAGADTGSGDDLSRCFCAYDGKATGVCTWQVRQADGSCPTPTAYEADETSCDQKDNDCDGAVDEGCPCDYEGQSTGVCTGQTRDGEGIGPQPTDYASDEPACDTKDNDCDGGTDEGCPCDYRDRSTGVCADLTRDGNGTCPTPPPYEPDETSCDQQDNDCDGVVDENCPCDYDSSSQGVCGNATIDPATGSCGEPSAYQQTESYCDDEDNDCDGAVDNADADVDVCTCTASDTQNCYTGPDGTRGVGACSAGSQTCQLDGTWGPCTNETTPEATESCDDADDDCDGVIDENCPCDYQQKSAGVCDDQVRDSAGTCPEPSNYQSPESTCGDASDNDCDGDTDCGDADCSGITCSGSGTACNFAAGSCEETACNDGVDNDDDGNADCGDSDCSGATCGGTGTECRQGDAQCHEAACGDGLDNDGDGQTDCRDADCNGLTCDGTGTECRAGDAQCHEADCADSQDNDADGSDDCADSDCDQQSCTRPNGNSGVCCPGADKCSSNLQAC